MEYLADASLEIPNRLHGHVVRTHARHPLPFPTPASHYIHPSRACLLRALRPHACTLHAGAVGQLPPAAAHHCACDGRRGGRVRPRHGRAGRTPVLVACPSLSLHAASCTSSPARAVSAACPGSSHAAL